MSILRLSRNAIVFLLAFNAACACLAQSVDALEEARAAFASTDYAKSMRLLQPLAEHGNARAQYGMGLHYLQGRGVSRDYDEALKWLLKAAEQGEARAQYALGGVYKEGTGVKQDYAEAARWFRKAAEQGNPNAQTMLGTFYGRGDGVPRDDAAALEWYRKAGEQGYGDAQWRIGTLYVRGASVPIDHAEAEKWFRKAASQEFAAGYFGLGHLYLNGLGIARDVDEAAKWFKLASVKARSVPTNEGEGAAKHSMIYFAGPLRDRALKVPAADLTSSYMAVKGLLWLLPAAEGGGTIQTPQGQIRAENAGPLKLEMQMRLSTYGAAVADRGYKTIAGKYRAATTASCERIGSIWAASIRAGILREVNIHQEGFELRIAQSTSPKDKPSILDAPGVVTEATLAFVEPGNSEFIFSGKITNEEITIVPFDIETLLANWPRWAGPPSRADLSNCRVTLIPVQP